MEGNQDYNNYSTAGAQPVYDQNQYGFTGADQQQPVDQAYPGFTYYDQFQQTTGNNMNSQVDPTAGTDGWYQSENLSYTNYLPDSQANPATQNTNLYKTKLCRHFQQKGFCNMGDKCNFAHGYEELKQAEGGAAAPKIPKNDYGAFQKQSFGAPQSQYKPHYNNQSDSIYYKTSLCRNFQENGYCQYGDKCKFAHGESDLKQAPPKVGGGPTGAYNMYAEQQPFQSSYYPTAAPMAAAPPIGFAYPAGYQPFPYHQASETAASDTFSSPTSTQVSDPAQNYGYNYTPDSKFYHSMASPAQPLQNTDTTNTGGVGSSAFDGGSETMNQYYNEMNYNQYPGAHQQ